MGKESAYSAGNAGLIPGSGRSPGEGNGNPLQYTCLENPMDKGAWQSTVHSVAKSQTQLKRLSTHRCSVRPLLVFTCLEISILYSATFLNSLFSILFLFSFPLWVFFLHLLFKHLYLEIPRIPKAQNKTKLSES